MKTVSCIPSVDISDLVSRDWLDITEGSKGGYGRSRDPTYSFSSLLDQLSMLEHSQGGRPKLRWTGIDAHSSSRVDYALMKRLYSQMKQSATFQLCDKIADDDVRRRAAKLGYRMRDLAT